MNHHPLLVRRLVLALAGTVFLLSGGGCVAAGDTRASVSPPGATAPLPAYGPNAVSYWDTIATNTINLPPAAGTEAEQLPVSATDMATVHVAIYDAAIAIAGTHKPYQAVPVAPAAGASTDAAVAAAAYGVLKGLFPSRTAQYEPNYYQALGAIADGQAKTRGVALGAEVAGLVLAARANDGRSVVLAPYVPGTGPGQFRGVNPINRYGPYLKTFSIGSASQFRADGPPALDSTTYTADFDEAKAYGALNSTVRSFEQTEAARFHTEPPPRFWPRNLRQFAMSQTTVAENARLMAMLYVSYADTVSGCFESKYHFEFWRPFSAITLADTDGNAATVADAGWTPVVPTPNHPEYPAAHACVFGAIGEVLSHFFGTKKISFAFDTTVAGISAAGMVHQYASTDDMEDDSLARIWGGMHFRTSVIHGRVLGMKTAKWVVKHHFGPRD